MATEIAFAQSFLAFLDTKPSKISPDHVEDPRTYPGHNTLKEAVAADTGLALGRIKLLFGKRPVADSKVLRDLVGASGSGGGEEVEVGVMILGGAGALAAARKAAAAAEEEEQEGSVVAQGLCGVGVLETEEFWEDLEGFLQQRVRDVAVAGEACGLFKGAWRGSRGW
ncbi:hypothetical protein BT67DRAFT_435262 [Trichocladium antarcticum]|uniref:Ubiquitin-like domain-containing protein n=1 Tax=Trichocladium antarcticum TaxID=1450529 RepID=A0AAN6UHA6_9PEZI|nr:hypothetical protein BT67DRAFT_435262 [Trichocladium antarcticum]